MSKPAMVAVKRRINVLKVQTIHAEPKAQLIATELIDSNEIKLRPVNDEVVSELASSLKEKGLLQPVLLRKVDGRYHIVFGEHRVAAAKKLELKHVSAVVREMDDFEELELKLTENVHRNQFVDPWEEGRIFARLLEEKYGGNIQALSKSVGKTANYIKGRLKVFEHFHQKLRQFVGRELTMSNAVGLSSLEPEQQLKLAKRIMQQHKAPIKSLASDSPTPNAPEQHWPEIPTASEICTSPKCGLEHKKPMDETRAIIRRIDQMSNA